MSTRTTRDDSEVGELEKKSKKSLMAVNMVFTRGMRSNSACSASHSLRTTNRFTSTPTR